MKYLLQNSNDNCQLQNNIYWRSTFQPVESISDLAFLFEKSTSVTCNLITINYILFHLQSLRYSVLYFISLIFLNSVVAYHVHFESGIKLIIHLSVHMKKIQNWRVNSVSIGVWWFKNLEGHNKNLGGDTIKAFLKTTTGSLNFLK